MRRAILAPARRRLTPAFWLCLVVLAACVPGSSPPAVSPTGVVAPGALEDEDAAGPLRVVYAGAEGEAPAYSAPQVVFNQPLRALEAADAEPSLGITLEPATPGRWQWLGSRALGFVPAQGRLPLATRFRVIVPEGVRSLQGQRLDSAVHFELETPRPAVLSAVPPAGMTGVEPHTPIVLGFNQKLELAELQRRTTLTAERAGSQRELSFELALAEDEAGTGEPMRVRVQPTGGYPTGSRIRLEIDAGLVGVEGPLASSAPFSLEFDTYGPLALLELACGIERASGCDPEAGLRLELSNPVRIGDLRRALQVTPAGALSLPGWVTDDDALRSVELTGSLTPRTRYEVALAAGLVDQYGQRLPERARRSVTTGDYTPRLRLGLSGEVLPAPSPKLVLGGLNTPGAELVARPLAASELAEYFEQWQRERTPFARLSALGGGERLSLPSDAANRPVRRALDLEQLLASTQGRGALALGLRYRDQRGEPVERARLLQVTNLAITAKLSRYGTRVWVTRLDTAEPVPGATVRVLGKTPPLALAYRTDALGGVLIGADDFRPELHVYDTKTDALIVAEHAGDSSFRRVRDFVPSWRLAAPIDFDAGEREHGFLFSERGLYRPGERVRVKGIVRREQAEGNAIVAGKALVVALRDANGEIVRRQSVTTNEFGTFAAELEIPHTAPLGGFGVVTEGLAGVEASTPLQVAEFRPAEFELSASAAAPSYVVGVRARFDLSASYLYGAPMSGAPVAYSVTRQRTTYVPPGAERFTTSDAAYWADLEQAALDSAVVSHTSAALDERGALALTVPLELPGQSGPELLRLDAEVTDVSRQALGTSASTLVHPASLYVGIERASEGFVSAPSRLEPRLVTLDPNGEPVSGRRVTVALVRRRWVTARLEAGSAERTLTRVVDEPRGQCAAISKREPVSCALDVREAGYYLLLASAQDEQGRLARAALPFYAIGQGRASFPDNDANTLELVTDKPSYRVGETARVLVKSPFERARALVTVERAGVHEARWVTLSGPTPAIDVPIASDMRPNVYVSVLVHAPAPKSEGALTAPAYRLGYTNLVVDPEERRLSVAIETRAVDARGAPRARTADYEPGDTVDVSLEVRDASGRPARAELTVYAVDEGVLSLSGYRVPDPVVALTEPRPLSVATLETRDALARVFLPDLGAGSDKGEAGGGGGEGARSDFRSVAHFDPEVLTDEQGRARARFSLPDSLTSYRLMAIAVSRDDRYGFASTRVAVSQRLMARPALPRFLNAGDTLSAGVVVSAKDFEPGSVRVRASFEGLVPLGPAEQVLELPRGGSREARFWVRAERVGEATFTFDVEGGGASDSVRVKREIRSPVRLETTAVYGETRGAEAQALGDVSRLRADVGGLELRLGSSALVGLDTALETLESYPYACTEQLASRLLPLGPLRELAAHFGEPAPRASLEAVAGEIVRRQAYDGGFPMWSGSFESDPWVSAYALWTLDQARSAGVSLSESVLERGSTYLERYLSEQREAPHFLAIAPLVLDVLAARGRPDLGALAYVFERRQELPLFARALLLHAAVGSRAGPSVVTPLQRELESRVALRGNSASIIPDERRWLELFDSETRSHALVLWALLAAEPRHPLASPLARALLEVRRGQGFQSTQESAYSLLALDAYRRAQEPTPPRLVADVWLGEERLLSRELGGPAGSVWQGELPMARLVAARGEGATPALIFASEGEGTLFYEARLRYAQQMLPERERERGIYVRKLLRTVDRAALARGLSEASERDQARFQAGDLVLGDVLVIAPQPRFYVAIDDPLPAGLEAIDMSLATTAGDLSLDVSSRAGARPTASSPFDRRELRDDRVLFFVDRLPAGVHHYRYLARATALGSFVVPPTRAEEMYQPEIFGRTGARSIEVVAAAR